MGANVFQFKTKPNPKKTSAGLLRSLICLVCLSVAEPKKMRLPKDL